MNIYQVVNIIKLYLETRFNEDKYYLQYKSDTEPDEFKTGSPDIFCFTMPSSLVINKYPARCPCIVITLNNRDDGVYTLVLNLCVANPSTADNEIVNKISKNIYELQSSGEYTTSSDEDLLVQSILFTDQVYNYMSEFSSFGVSKISAEYATPDLEDHPYAISTVTVDVVVNKENVGARLYDNYY